MITIHRLNNSKNTNYPNQCRMNKYRVRHVLRIISALRNAPKEPRLKLTGLDRCLHRERLKAAAQYVHPHVRKAYPIHHFQATRTRKRQTSDEQPATRTQNQANSDEKRTTSTAQLYYSRECSIFIENIRQINLFLQNKPNFKKVKSCLKLYTTKTYAKIDTWWNEKTNPIQTQFSSCPPAVPAPRRGLPSEVCATGARAAGTSSKVEAQPKGKPNFKPYAPTGTFNFCLDS